jgi:hypothetical protein
MNPQGWFHSVTWIPKLVITQALTIFPNTHNNPSTHLSSTQTTPPKRMDLHPSLPHSPSGSPSPSRIQHNWSRISMLELSGLIVVNKDGHRPTHLRHASLKSWLDYTRDLYNQGYHGFSSSICFPFPSQDTDDQGGTMSDR